MDRSLQARDVVCIDFEGYHLLVQRSLPLFIDNTLDTQLQRIAALGTQAQLSVTLNKKLW
jgi:hypothetical protein